MIENVSALQNISHRPNMGSHSSEDISTGNQSAHAFEQFEAALRETERASESALIGQSEPHELVHSIAQTQLAVETVVTVRNKLVEAYQEILRMPV